MTTITTYVCDLCGLTYTQPLNKITVTTTAPQTDTFDVCSTDMQKWLSLFTLTSATTLAAILPPALTPKAL